MSFFKNKEERAAASEQRWDAFHAKREQKANAVGGSNQRKELGLGPLEPLPGGLSSNLPTLTLVKHYQTPTAFRSDAQKKAGHGWTLAGQSSVRHKQSMVTYTCPNPYYSGSQPAPESAPPAATQISTASELERLAALWQQGVLSDEEFSAQKAKLLA